MKKKQVKTKVKYTNQRTGIIPFTPTGRDQEQLPVKSLRYALEENINHYWKINELGIKIEMYNRDIDLCVDPQAKLMLKERCMELTAKFYEANEWATAEKTQHMIDRPNEWFDSLGKEDMDDLKRKVYFWNMRVDVDELGFEIIQHLYLFFNKTKGKSTFTGEQVSDEIQKIKSDYLTLKKKSKCLDTVLRSVRQEIVEDALTPIQDGPLG